MPPAHGPGLARKNSNTNLNESTNLNLERKPSQARPTSSSRPALRKNGHGSNLDLAKVVSTPSQPHTSPTMNMLGRPNQAKAHTLAQSHEQKKIEFLQE